MAVHRNHWLIGRKYTYPFVTANRVHLHTIAAFRVRLHTADSKAGSINQTIPRQSRYVTQHAHRLSTSSKALTGLLLDVNVSFKHRNEGQSRVESAPFNPRFLFRVVSPPYLLFGGRFSPIGTRLSLFETEGSVLQRVCMYCVIRWGLARRKETRICSGS